MQLITNTWGGNGCQFYGGNVNGQATPSDVPTLLCVFSALQNIVNTLLFFAGIVALFFILFGGMKFLLAAGNPEKIDSAKKTITYAIIGLVVVILTFSFVNILGYILGRNFTQVNIQ